MSTLDQIAFFQKRQDEVPNQELARQLAKTGDMAGIQEIAENLWNKNPAIQSDCLKVLYEVGYLKPELISRYAQDFFYLIHNRNNRLVWGAMIALSTIARIAAEELFPHTVEIVKVMEKGSVITNDAGITALAGMAAARDDYAKAIFPYLLQRLGACRPSDVARYAEKITAAVKPEMRAEFVAVLEKRMEDLAPAQVARTKKVLR